MECDTYVCFYWIFVPPSSVNTWSGSPTEAVPHNSCCKENPACSALPSLPPRIHQRGLKCNTGCWDTQRSWAGPGLSSWTFVSLTVVSGLFPLLLRQKGREAGRGLQGAGADEVPGKLGLERGCSCRVLKFWRNRYYQCLSLCDYKLPQPTLQ